MSASMEAARKFVKQWKDHGYEKGETQKFWLSLLYNVFGIVDVISYIYFEQQINGKFIDARIPTTNVLIEQKSIGKDLEAAFLQAKAYDNELPFNKKSRWIVTSDFQSFQIYDMNQSKAVPEIIKLTELPKKLDRLMFLVEPELPEHERISLQAGEIVKKMYDALKKSYKNLTPDILMSLNKLCMRLVFCLYADSVIFKDNQFRNYLNSCGAKLARQGLIELFKVLNTPKDKRDDNLDDILNAFPYVNGGLFEEIIDIPKITDEILYFILASPEDFSWSMISPTIFGAIFESITDFETRRAEGMHYTSIENIHKVIDPLFLDDLNAEFKSCKGKKKDLMNLQNKLASLTFFDPACGSGNFLTETFISLRQLENKIIKELVGGIEIKLGDLENPIRVTIDNFYGIEIKDFAVKVARTALWISELQMTAETAEIVHKNLEVFPIKTRAVIERANALQVDWKSFVPNVDYIIGNPQFLGYSFQTDSQKKDLKDATGLNSKKIDYVCGWYFKAADYIQGTNTRCAFVSTNSICQGEQVAIIWKPLLKKIHIDFAYRTFKWTSESTDKAAVHCVIIGFSAAPYYKPKIIFEGDVTITANNINGYLVDGENVFIDSRNKPICDVPVMMRGSQATDDGNLIMTEDEMKSLIKLEPLAQKFIRPFMMGKDFIDRKPRYCLWLVGAEPNELCKMPLVLKRIKAVKEYRLKSTKAATRKKAETPTLFDEVRDCKTDYIAVPKVSSEQRKYIPIDYLTSDIVAGDSIRMLPNAKIYHFGVLTSIVHMAWMRMVTGRLKSDYSYSNTIVYNNFVWPEVTEKQRKKIEASAQHILNVRANSPNSSLADLYSPLTMPPELLAAHQANDKAVMQAYGFSKSMTENEIVAELMRLYRKLSI